MVVMVGVKGGLRKPGCVSDEKMSPMSKIVLVKIVKQK